MKDGIGLYRRNGKNIYIKQPEFKELSFVARLWSDKETMKDIGGVFNFPESKWEMFYKKMVHPSDGNNFYCLVYKNDNEPIGEVSFHGYDSITKIARFNVKILKEYRNNGFGEEAVKLLLEYFFLEFGGEMIMDNISTKEGLKIAEKLGFIELRQYKDEISVKITKDEFLQNRIERKKNIGILIFDDMTLADYSVAIDLLEKSNDIEGENYLNIYSLGVNNKITASNVEIVPHNIVDKDSEKVDVLILPSGQGVEKLLMHGDFINYLKNNFNKLEYIISLGNSIKILEAIDVLAGIAIPENLVLKNDVDIFSTPVRRLEKNSVDNGKIMISENLVGEIEIILTLIKKMRGNKVAQLLAKKVGVK